MGQDFLYKKFLISLEFYSVGEMLDGKRETRVPWIGTDIISRAAMLDEAKGQVGECLVHSMAKKVRARKKQLAMRESVWLVQDQTKPPKVNVSWGA